MNRSKIILEFPKRAMELVYEKELVKTLLGMCKNSGHLLQSYMGVDLDKYVESSESYLDFLEQTIQEVVKDHNKSSVGISNDTTR